MATHYIDTVTRAYSTDNVNWKTMQDGINVEYNATNVFVTPVQRFNAVNTFIANGFTVNPANDVIFLNGVQKVAGTYTISTATQLLQSVFINANSSYGGTGYLGQMTTTQRDNIAVPVPGTFIYNTTNGIYETYEDVVWTWLPMGWQQQGLNKFYIDVERTFYTVNSDGYYTISQFNSGSAGNGVMTNGTSEVGGACVFNTNALSNGRTFLSTGNASVVFGSGVTMFESRIYIPVLSNATDRFTGYWGFSDNTGGIDVANGMGILYDEGGVSAGGTASPNFQLTNAVNSVRSFYTTNVVVAINTWYRLRTLVAKDGSWIRHYINDALVNVSGADITTNIPTGYLRASRAMVAITKNTGTTNRTFYLNTVRFRQKYDNIRA